MCPTSFRECPRHRDVDITPTAPTPASSNSINLSKTQQQEAPTENKLNRTSDHNHTLYKLGRGVKLKTSTNSRPR